MQTQEPNPSLYFDTLSAYQRTEALRAAIELDLFSQIGKGLHTAEEIANACQASPRGIRILADYLSILGFLEKQDNLYKLSPDSRLFLDRRSPAYLGDATRFMLTPAMRDCFLQLTQAVRQGGTAAPQEGTVSSENPIWVEFARGMAPLMRGQAGLLTALVKDEPERRLRVLDVAAGHGLFGITLASRFPQAHITALDWKSVLEVAQENARSACVADRYALLPGSAFDVDWGGPYDLVLLTNFLHHFDVPSCRLLAEKAFAALAPGGRAMTLEFIPDPDRVSPPPSASFSLVMLATTPHGDAYTFAELESIFSHAGFSRSEFHPLPPTPQQAVISYKE